jgi:acetyl coenzyme A synthetase (ADP forming)-like protein
MDESTRSKLECLFSPKSVVVLGASSTPGKWGFNVFNRVLRTSSGIRVYPINPSAPEVLGVRAYQRVTDVPDTVDLAVVVIPPQYVPAAMDECALKGVKAAVIISAGFKETGKEGAELEEQVVRIARRSGIRFVGPNCNGHFSTAADLYTTGEAGIKRGPLALVSQSGNFGGYILGRGTARGIGFSKYVSSGNEADLHLEDYIEYLAEDKETKVIGAYVEGLRDGRRFLDIARRITGKKPIVVMKVGRTKEGAQAAQSHTGALSGSDEIHDAAFRQSGVIRVDEVDDLFDVALALIRQPLPKGKRIGILTIGGGFGVVATDACRRLGLEMPPLTEETIQTLNKYLPPRWSHANPVDMAGETERSYPCLGTLLKADNIDAILAVGCVGYRSQGLDQLGGIAREKLQEYGQRMVEGELALVDGLVERVDRYSKPLIITASAGRGESAAIARLEQNGIYGYPTPERGVKVLSYLVKYADYIRESGRDSG